MNKFLAAWDEGLKDKCVPAESINSVRVMTIHKSKGLEFHTVIVPFCDWKLTGDTNLLWCKPNAAPYNTLSLLPISNKKEMLNSIYKDDYYNEFKYQIVDNLNILYVAATRAKSNLIMFSDNVASKSNKISDLVNNVAPQLPKFLDDSVYDSEENTLRYGTIVPSEDNVEKVEEKTKEKNPNPFEEKPDVMQLPFSYHDSKIEFRQSRELARFLAKDSEEEKQLDYIAE